MLSREANRPAVTIDRDYAVRTACGLVRIDSRNPALEAGAPGELEIARFVAEQIDAPGGWEVELRRLGDRHANVVAVRKGGGGGPSLMINAHLDTVATAGMEDPFSGELRDGRIYGRGAQDTKGGIAAVLAAARALGEADVALEGDVVVAFVADEEHESLGTEVLLERVRTDAAIVIEPTDLDVCVAHRGFGVLELRAEGRLAHGGRSDLGVDANLHMGLVLAGLAALRERWARRPAHPLLGAPALHVPLIRGGRGLFTYADESVAHLEVRTVPGQTEAEVKAEVEEVLAEVAERVERFEGSARPVIWRPPHEIDPERPIVRRVLAAARDVRDTPARLIGHGWWEDSGLLGAAGIDTVILGPRGEGLHTDEEWVEIDSVVDLAEILLRTVLAHSGGTDRSESADVDDGHAHDDERGSQ